MDWLSTILLYTFFLYLSRPKGVFFINLTKKFFRVFGYVLCALMLIVTVFLIICAAAFGTKNVVDVFGANIYIVQMDGFDKAPKGSAILVQKTTAYDLSEGKLVLYSTGSSVNECTLGYVKNIYVVDGQYYLTVSDGTMSSEVGENRLIGRADYSSVFVGTVIEFIKTPFGVFCIAVLPCIALILYDIIRTAASRLPDPEVEPQYKNYSGETGNLEKAAANRRSISVNSDGRASYSKNIQQKTSSGESVLFSYGQKKSVPQNNRPIIPLVDREPTKSAPQNQPTEKPKINPAVMPKTAETPENIAVSRYISNSQNAALQLSSITSEGNTAEIPQLPKRDNGDAFFAQTTSSSLSKGIPTANNAPQIGRQITKRPRTDVSDSANDSVRTPKSAGKRSSQILASKRVEDLIGDDDDIRSKKRITNTMVDDIMSDIKNSDKERL